MDEGDGEAPVEGASMEEAVTSTPKSKKLPLKPRTKTSKRKGRRKSRSSSRDLPSHWQREKGGGRVAPHLGTCQVTGKDKREEKESLLIQGLAKSLAKIKGRRKSRSSSRDLPSHWQR